MTTADGSLLPDYGKIQLLVQVGMKMYGHPFVVAKFTNEGILGTDFLRALEGSIDFATNKVWLDGKAMATCNWSAGNRCYQVSLAEEVVIPVGHWMVVPGKMPAGVFPGGSWMVDS